MKRSILLVEDERIVALSEMNTLRRHGYEVIWTATGQEAEAIVDQNSEIALILMDIDLGRGDDGSVAAQKILDKHDIPIVFLTSHSDQETVEQVRDLASYGYVVKDSGSFVLVESVRMALELFEAHSRSRESEIQYRSLFESSVDPIVVYDKDATVIMANESAAKLVNLTRETVLGRSLSELYPEYYPITRERIQTVLREKRTLSCSDNVTLKSGARRLYQSKYRPLRLAGFSGPLVQLWMIEMADELSDDIGFNNESILPAITQNAPGFVFQLVLEPGGDFSFPYVSESIHRYFGYTALDVTTDGEVLLNAIPQPDRQRVVDHAYESARTLQTYSITHRLITQNNEEKWLKAQASPLEREDGAVVWTGISIDVTDEHLATLALAEREAEYRRLAERYRFLTETTGELVCLHEPDGTYLYISPSMRDIIGYEPESLIGSCPYELVHPDDRQRVRSRHRKAALHGSTPEVLEYRVRHRDGYYVWLETSSDLTKDQNGNPLNMVTKSRDISARKLDEQRIKKALEEQEYLVREMNHRIKNNLAMMRSLVELKQNTFAQPVDLSDLVSRIEAIRILHEMMHRSDTTKSVDVEDYLTNLVTAALSASGSEDVETRVSIDPLLLPADTALPLALIVNEVVTNAVKHGFAHAEKPELWLSLAHNDDRCVVRVGGTGPAIPSEAFENSPGGLGLKLVQVLAEQINAELTLPEGENPTFVLTCRTREGEA